MQSSDLAFFGYPDSGRGVFSVSWCCSSQLAFWEGQETCSEWNCILLGSEWILSSSTISTGLPKGRYCDLASYDGRRIESLVVHFEGWNSFEVKQHSILFWNDFYPPTSTTSTIQLWHCWTLAVGKQVDDFARLVIIKLMAIRSCSCSIWIWFPARHPWATEWYDPVGLVTVGSYWTLGAWCLKEDRIVQLAWSMLMSKVV